MAEAVAVVDTGPLLHLCEIGGADLLCVFARLQGPDAVREEFVRLAVTPALAGAQSLLQRVVWVTGELPSTTTEDLAMLQAADIQVLALAMSEQCTLLTDDLSLRRRAEARGLLACGSVGVAVRAFGSGLLPYPQLVETVEQLLMVRSLYTSAAAKVYLRNAIRSLA